MTSILAFTFALMSATSNCPFCSGTTGQTLAGEYNAAALIVVGTLKNAVRNLEDPDKSTTELHVSSVIKDHPYLTGKKVLILPRYFPPPDPTKPDDPVLVFAGVYPSVHDNALAGLASGAVFGDFNRYRFDPYRGDTMTGKGELAIYLKHAMEIKDKPVPERLNFYFKFLDAQDLLISSDAFLEFAQADYKDVREFAKSAPLEKVAAWLVDPNTPPSHFGFYGLLLGHSRKAEDAALLRRLLDEPKKYFAGGIDGLLGGYILLDPVEGWKYLLSLIQDPKSKFETRYAGLRTLRFFWEFRPEVVGKEKMLDAFRALLKDLDIADMPINDLRRWKVSDLTSEIIAMAKAPATLKETFVRRALVMYLLYVAPNSPEASALVTEFRAKQPEWVKVAEDSLAQERLAEDAKKTESPPPATKPGP